MSRAERLGTPRIARALQYIGPMPRKQRFKPSRKPQSTQGVVSSTQMDDRKEIIPEPQREPQRDQQRDVERDEPVIKGDSEVE